MKSQIVGWVIAAILVCSCSPQPDSPAPPPPPVPPVRDTRFEMYQLQEKCAKDAHDWYKREWEDVQIAGVTSTYTNHYNSKSERCFLMVASTTYGKPPKTGVGISVDSRTLLDVLENRPVGVFDKSSNRPQPWQCEVGGTQCASADEWDRMAKPYMDE